MLRNLNSFHSLIVKPDAAEGKSSKVFPLIAVPLLLGIIFGACVGMFSLVPKEFASLLSVLQDQASDGGLLQTALRSFRLILISFFLAFTLYGVILLPPLSFLRGFLLGCSVAAVFQSEGLHGLLLAALSIGIPAIFGVPAFILSSVNAFRISSSLLCLFFRNRRGGFAQDPVLVSQMLLAVLLCVFETIYSCFLLPVLLRAFQ